VTALGEAAPVPEHRTAVAPYERRPAEGVLGGSLLEPGAERVIVHRRSLRHSVVAGVGHRGRATIAA
jgi:hypothetical protein